jgi:predicted transcriptional regulator of viral defense system
VEHSKRQQVITLARQIGALRPRDLAERELPPEYLSQLARQGVLERIGRGLYRLADGEPGEHQSLVEACARVPHGVLCLLTALRYHELTTQAPAEIWMALEEHARYPAAPEIPLHIVRFSGDVFTTGIEEHLVDGVTVRVYGLEKTIVDCFKYRNKIGIDVAMEALREGWRARRINMTDLWHYAKIDRVTNVMRPYLEMIAA